MSWKRDSVHVVADSPSLVALVLFVCLLFHMYMFLNIISFILCVFVSGWVFIYLWFFLFPFSFSFSGVL